MENYCPYCPLSTFFIKGELNITGNSERTIERRFVSEVEKKGGMAIKLFASSWVGIPDRLVLIPGGKVWFVELKKQGSQPRPIQLKRHQQLRSLGFKVDVVFSIEDINRFVSEVFE